MKEKDEILRMLVGGLNEIYITLYPSQLFFHIQYLDLSQVGHKTKKKIRALLSK